MPRFIVREMLTTEWEVAADDAEAAKGMVQQSAAPLRPAQKSNYEVVAEIPDPVEQYWEAHGTFTITRYGTREQAVRDIRDVLDEALDDYEIQDIE